MTSRYCILYPAGRTYKSKKKRHRKKHPKPSVYLMTWGWYGVAFNVINGTAELYEHRRT